jgi:hypothetical protein
MNRVVCSLLILTCGVPFCLAQPPRGNPPVPVINAPNATKPANVANRFQSTGTGTWSDLPATINSAQLEVESREIDNPNNIGQEGKSNQLKVANNGIAILPKGAGTYAGAVQIPIVGYSPTTKDYYMRVVLYGPNGVAIFSEWALIPK